MIKDMIQKGKGRTSLIFSKSTVLVIIDPVVGNSWGVSLSSWHQNHHTDVHYKRTDDHLLVMVMLSYSENCARGHWPEAMSTSANEMVGECLQPYTEVQGGLPFNKAYQHGGLWGGLMNAITEPPETWRTVLWGAGFCGLTWLSPLSQSSSHSQQEQFPERVSTLNGRLCFHHL